MSYNIYKKHLKKVFDSCVALLVFLCIWPILLLLYILLRFSIGTPVLFKQRRPGYLGKPFTIYKFRTMTNMCDKTGRLLPDEKRITRIGMFIRSLSLDELPEIFNILKGEMSLVGPRPLMMQYLDRYTLEQARRHDVMPGITGWVQINGRNNLIWEEKFKLDVWYVDHQSFKLDIYIILKTFWKVFSREGISHGDFVAAPEFMGSPSESEHPKHESEENLS